jgi:hypothetical protein
MCRSTWVCGYVEVRVVVVVVEVEVRVRVVEWDSSEQVRV